MMVQPLDTAWVPLHCQFVIRFLDLRRCCITGQAQFIVELRVATH